MRRCVVVVAVWFFVAVAVTASAQPLTDVFFLLAALVMLIYALVTLVVMIVVIRRLAGFYQQSWPVMLAVPLLAAGLVFLGGPLSRAGDFLTFQAMRPHYVKAVEQALAGQSPETGTHLAVDISVDESGTRVAFNKGGLIDNWSGIIYDPSDIVATAKGWDMSNGGQAYTATPEAKSLFGGDLVSCYSLGKPFYRCGFT